jgi:hypothetical protein
MAPSDATADWIVRPFLGAAVGPEHGFVDLEQTSGDSKLVFGAAAGWQRRTIGVEVELSVLRLPPATQAGVYSFDCGQGSTSTPTYGTAGRSLEMSTEPASANSSSRSHALRAAWCCGSSWRRHPD